MESILKRTPDVEYQCDIDYDGDTDVEGEELMKKMEGLFKSQSWNVFAKEDESLKLVKETQTELLQMKAKFEDQSKMMSDLRATGENNEILISCLFTKISKSETERKEGTMQMRSSHEMRFKEIDDRFKETDDRLSGAIAAMSGVIRTTFEEEKNREMTSVVERREKKVSGFKERREMLEEALKQSQKLNKSFETELEKQHKEIEDKIKRLSEKHQKEVSELKELNEMLNGALKESLGKNKHLETQLEKRKKIERENQWWSEKTPHGTIIRG